jgi:hypothetical protein
MQSDADHLIANEKLLGELAGVIVAIVAMWVLARLERNVRDLATEEQSHTRAPPQ